MASFLARAAGIGPNPPVANAARLNGQPAAFYQPAGQPIASATNASLLEGYPASALAGRAARALNPLPLELKSSYQDFLSLNLTAPAPGFVVVTAVVQVVRDVGTCNRPCVVSAQVVAASEGSFPMNTMGLDFTGETALATVTHVFPVTTAGQHTFTLHLKHSGTSPGAVLAQIGSMSAIYAPFGPTGGNTLDLP
jgi:hypothetical protein